MLIKLSVKEVYEIYKERERETAPVDATELW